MIYGKSGLWHSHVDYTIREGRFMQAQDGRNDRKTSSMVEFTVYCFESLEQGRERREGSLSCWSCRDVCRNSDVSFMRLVTLMHWCPFGTKGFTVTVPNFLGGERRCRTTGR